MIPHLLYVGGEDHHLRIPFMLSMRDCGFRVTAAGSGDPTAFKCADLDFRPFHFKRYVSPLADRTAVKAACPNPKVVQGACAKAHMLNDAAIASLRHQLRAAEVEALTLCRPSKPNRKSSRKSKRRPHKSKRS